MRPLSSRLLRRLAARLFASLGGLSLGASAACATPPGPPIVTGPAMVPSASTSASASTAPAPLGPRCPSPGVVGGHGPGVRRVPTAMAMAPLRRPITIRPSLPPLAPFGFRVAPAAEAPSTAAKLEPGDWQELAHWFVRAVVPTGSALARRAALGDPLASGDARRSPDASAGVIAYLPFLPPKSPLRNAATRVSLVRALGPAVRAIAASAWFESLYARNRALELGGSEAAAPTKATPASVRANAVAKQCAYLDQLRAALDRPGLSADERVSVEAGVAATEAQIDRWLHDPTLAEEWAASEHAADIARAVDQRERAEERKTALAGTYPESARAALLGRLDALVAATADVDFTAKTTQRGPHKVFVDPAYEQKPPEWKAAYRLGKPTVEALRTFAAEWRKDLVAAGGP